MTSNFSILPPWGLVLAKMTLLTCESMVFICSQRRELTEFILHQTRKKQNLQITKRDFNCKNMTVPLLYNVFYRASPACEVECCDLTSREVFRSSKDQRVSEDFDTDPNIQFLFSIFLPCLLSIFCTSRGIASAMTLSDDCQLLYGNFLGFIVQLQKHIHSTFIIKLKECGEN